MFSWPFTFVFAFLGISAVHGQDWSRLVSLSVHDGPNCHNAGLMVAGLQRVHRFTSGEELGFWLQSYCKQIPPNGTIVKGDLRIFRFFDLTTGATRFWHTQAFIDSSTLFEKMGTSSTQRYQFTTYKMLGRSSEGGATWQDALRTEDCNWAAGTPRQCHLFINHYRCFPEVYEQELAAQKSLLEPVGGESFLKRLDDVEQRLNRFVLGPFRYSELALLKDEVMSLNEIFRSIPLSKGNSVYISLNYRIQGLLNQIDFPPIEIHRSIPPIDL